LDTPSRAIRAIRASSRSAGPAARYFYESFSDKDAFVVAVFGAVAADIATTTQAAMAAAPPDEQSRADISFPLTAPDAWRITLPPTVIGDHSLACELSRSLAAVYSCA
jgi:AcrR family transcriptional regulator